MHYAMFDRVPTPSEHRRLAESVGWHDAFRWDAMATSLEGSRCGVVVFDERGTVVAMGPAVGDGSFYLTRMTSPFTPITGGKGSHDA